MFNVSKIHSILSGLVGWKQPYNPSYAIIDDANLMSLSGYYVNDNPFAKVELIKDTQDYKNISDSEFNTILSDIVKRSITNVCSQVFDSSSYIDRQVLYKYASNKVETDSLPNGFVGYEIKIDDTKSVSFTISRALLDFEGTDTITLYMFNSAKKDPIKTQEITIDSDHQEVTLDWVFNDTDTIYKGNYYIGYIKDDNTTVSPYKRNYENSEVMSYVEHLCISKIFVSDHTSNTLFDLNDTESLSESTGLNFDITVNDDYTDLIINNKSLFSRAIYLQAVINTLQIYMASLRSSRDSGKSKDLYNKILLEIEGTRGEDNVISVKGLRPQLLSEISDIKKEIKKLRDGYFGSGWQVITEM